MSMKLFISYSRADSRFVDRLQQDLRSRDFDPWVDRSRLEGGQDYTRRIEGAIRAASVVLVVVSPEAVASPWVLDEIHVARTSQKTIIPVLLRTSEVPMELGRLQFEDFRGDYDAGLTGLLRALVAAPHLPPPLPLPAVPAAPPGVRSTLVQLPDPVPPPDPDLDNLQNAGFVALSQNDLETALIYFEQIHERSAGFNGGFIDRQLPDLRRRAVAARVLRLRTQAQAAQASGNWHEVAGAWEALLGQDAADAEARAALPEALIHVGVDAWGIGRWDEAIGAWRGAIGLKIAGAAALQAAIAAAEQYRALVYVYQNIAGFIAQQNIPTARLMLQALWEQAPAYGDPQGLAASCGLAVPLNGLVGPWAVAHYEQFLAARQWEDAAQMTALARIVAPQDSAWSRRAAQSQLAQHLAALQDRYDAAMQAWDFAAAIAACEAALKPDRAPNDPPWTQRRGQAQAALQEVQRQAQVWPLVERALGFAIPARIQRELHFTPGTAHDGKAYIIAPLATVPAGPFWMGTEGDTSSEPRQQLTLPAYQIGVYPVTVAEYACALAAGAAKVSQPADWATQRGKPDHPVTTVSWHDAMAYIAWLRLVTGDQSWRLPTEAEWEKAARGMDGRIYPWGNEWVAARANVGGGGGTTPVGEYAARGDASPYGCHDMAGNVWEWTSSIWRGDRYNNDNNHENDSDEASVRVGRGGSWGYDPRDARAACRSGGAPGVVGGSLGFRLARALPPGSR